MVTEITKADIENGVISNPNVMHVIMFYGTTCGPCKGTMPHYEIASDNYNQKTDRIRFYKIHSWDEAQKEYCKETWGIEGVPHFKLMLRGMTIHEKRGGGDLDAMTKMVHEAIDQVFKVHGERL
jgi:thiol-disulfide isomerase/thioredoxin